MEFTQQRVKFPNRHGLSLAGKVVIPEGDVQGWGLMAHCFTCGKDLRIFHHLAKQLAAQGYGTLRFDFTGIGESEGEFSQSNFTSNLNDLLAAQDFLASLYEGANFALGHSLGGAALLAAAKDLGALRCLITVNSPSDTHHLKGNLALLDPAINEQGEGRVLLGGKYFRISRQFLADLETHDVLQAVRGLTIPLLVVQAMQDETVLPFHGDRLFEAARSEKTLVHINTEHLVNEPQDAADIAQLILAWLNRQLRSA